MKPVFENVLSYIQEINLIQVLAWKQIILIIRLSLQQFWEPWEDCYWPAYLYRGEGPSHHLATLSKILEQIEDLKSEEVESFKERIENLLRTIESTYVRH